VLDDRATRKKQALKRGVGLGVTLIALQAMFSSGATASTLAITRAAEIREKMTKIHDGLVGKEEKAPVLHVQNWRNWANFGGWLPRPLRGWRWPRD